VLIGVLVAALLMDKGGLSMAMGSFVLGIMLSNSDFRFQVKANVLPLKGLFLALFFVAVGMSIDIRLVAELLWVVLGFVLLVLAIKILTIAALARAFGLTTPDAVRAAFLLAPCSEFGFVVFAAAEGGGLLTADGFAIAVAVVSLSMALTPVAVALGYRLAEGRSSETKAQPQLKELSEELENHVVVAGYGRCGRLMSLMLEKTDTPYIAFDLDLTRIYDGKQEGHNVHYGDVTDAEMQGAAAFAKAKSVVITLDDVDAATRLVVALRNFYPHLPIQVAAPDLPTRDRLRALGAAEVVCTNVEGGLQLGEGMLRAAGAAEPDIDALVEALRDSDYALVR
jgi:glutathione-regulated potassium-efflux system protein KefB